MCSEKIISILRPFVLLVVCLLAAVFRVNAATNQDSTGNDYRYWPDEKFAAESIRPYGTYLPFYSREMEVRAHEKSLREKFIQFHNSSRPLVRALIYLTIFFFLFLLINLSVIFIHRVRDIRNERLRKRLITKYENLIAEVVFDMKPIPDPEGLRQEMKKPFIANVLLESILGLHRNLSGEAADALKALYINMGLDHISLKKVKSRRWFIKAKGFRELAQMSISTANDEIHRHLNSPHPVLRIESRLAWIRLNPANPFGFLDAPDIQITEWGKLNALATLMNNRLEIDSYERWLSSPNPAVVVFALQMAGVFRHSHYSSSIVAKIVHEDDAVRYAAYDTTGRLGLTEAAPSMFMSFRNETARNKKKILEVLAELTDISCIGFFEDVIREGNADTAIPATRALLLLGSPGKQALARLIQSGRIEVSEYMLHFKETES